MKLEDLISLNQAIDFETLKADEELVRQIQTELNERLLYPSSMIDGLYGDRTHQALVEFCEDKQLNNMQTMQFGKTFAEKLLAATTPSANKFLSDADFKQAANLLDVDVAIIKAIVAVESSGRGFLKEGQPKILFERHIFYKQTQGVYASKHPDICNKKTGGYLGNAAEWDRLERAIQLDRKAALKSASWGLGQIMGFNHEVVGYSDIDDFVQAMHESEAKQLAAMMNFLKASNLVSALRDRDWQKIARFYNGPNGVGVYDVKLAKAYKSFA
jgi:hypothetical protein